MDIFEAIETRRSLAHLQQKEVAPDLIEKVLSAGIWAPNHRLTQPWHFYVFQSDSRQKLADALMENFHRDNPDATPEAIEKAQKKNPRRVLQTPVCVLVTCDGGRDAIETHENYGACCCAVQNILLAAHSKGLGVYWRTGDTLYTKPSALHDLLKLPETTSFVALLLMGYPEEQHKTPRRAPLEEKLTWMN